MPRAPRQIEVDGIYHVVNRGVEQRRIYLKNQDYSRFVFCLEFFNDTAPVNLWEIVALAAKPRGAKAGTDPALYTERLEAWRSKKREPLVELLEFELMPNHYHLVMREIRPGGISEFMKKLGGYASYFNKQYGRVGPLFQSRFKAVQIKGDIQLANVFVYVHTNCIELKEPGWKDFKVRDLAGALRWRENYKWSSYHDYVGRPLFPTVTERRFLLDFFGGQENCRRAVEDWIAFKAANAELGNEVLE